MAERDFEFDLERMFAQAPACPDPDGFARKVEAKMSRDWRVRTLGIGAAGVIGGVIAFTQSVGAGLGGRIQNFSANTASTALAADGAYDHFWTQFASVLNAPGVGMFWVTSAVLVVAAVVGVTRAFDQV